MTGLALILKLCTTHGTLKQIRHDTNDVKDLKINGISFLSNVSTLIKNFCLYSDEFSRFLAETYALKLFTQLPLVKKYMTVLNRCDQRPRGVKFGVGTSEWNALCYVT